MSVTKGSRQSFSKKGTNVSIPAVTQPRQVSGVVSLTGQANISEVVDDSLYFHVFGAVPADIRLFIYGELFNQHFYTELGQHDHGPGTLGTDADSHSHNISGNTNNTGNHSHNVSGNTDSDTHTHSIEIGVGDNGNRIDIDGASNTTFVFGFIGNDNHSHNISGNTNNTGGHSHNISGNTNSDNHSHSVTTGLSGTRGTVPAAGSLNTTASKQYFDDLQIEIDGVDQTAALLAQAGLAKFGDGTNGHQIVTNGVELQLGSFINTAGQHKIRFNLGGSNNGGRLRYNLYLLG